MIEIKFVKAIKGNFYHIYAENGKSWDLVGRYSNYAVRRIFFYDIDNLQVTGNISWQGKALSLL